MHIITQCPHCAATYKLAAEAAGRQAKCKCGQMFVVQPMSTSERQPGAGGPVQVPNAATRSQAVTTKSALFVPPEVVVESDDEEAASPKSRILIFGGGVCIAVIVLGLCVFFCRDRANNSPKHIVDPGQTNTSIADLPVKPLKSALDQPVTQGKDVKSSSKGTRQESGTGDPGRRTQNPSAQAQLGLLAKSEHWRVISADALLVTAETQRDLLPHLYYVVAETSQSKYIGVRLKTEALIDNKDSNFWASVTTGNDPIEVMCVASFNKVKGAFTGDDREGVVGVFPRDVKRGEIEDTIIVLKPTPNLMQVCRTKGANVTVSKFFDVAPFQFTLRVITKPTGTGNEIKADAAHSTSVPNQPLETGTARRPSQSNVRFQRLVSALKLMHNEGTGDGFSPADAIEMLESFRKGKMAQFMEVPLFNNTLTRNNLIAQYGKPDTEGKDTLLGRSDIGIPRHDEYDMVQYDWLKLLLDPQGRVVALKSHLE